MNEILVRLATATLLLSVSAVVVQALMLVLRPSSAGVRQCAWFCVLVQGIVLFHLPVRVPWYGPPPDGRIGGKTQDVPQLSAEGPSGTKRTEPEPTESASATPVVFAARPSQPSQVTYQRDWSKIGVALWVSGIAGLVIFSGLSYAVFLRQLAQGRPGTSDWAEELRELLRQRSIVCTISLLVTRSIGPALCWAPWSYRICVPGPSWAKLAPTQRCHILRHELAHFERADLWRLLVVRLLALPHWFNPFAWWAVHEIAQSAEWACDQAATGRNPGDAIEFAKALVRLGVASSLGVCPARAAGRSSLFVRIRRLMHLKSTEDSRMKKMLILAAAAGLVAINLVRIELVAREPEAGTPPLVA
ncbi:MAG: M56 family metallopeptidase, partial [Thermoguttaceae bacterium]